MVQRFSLRRQLSKVGPGRSRESIAAGGGGTAAFCSPHADTKVGWDLRQLPARGSRVRCCRARGRLPLPCLYCLWAGERGCTKRWCVISSCAKRVVNDSCWGRSSGACWMLPAAQGWKGRPAAHLRERGGGRAAPLCCWAAPRTKAVLRTSQRAVTACSRAVLSLDRFRAFSWENCQSVKKTRLCAAQGGSHPAEPPHGPAPSPAAQPRAALCVNCGAGCTPKCQAALMLCWNLHPPTIRVLKCICQKLEVLLLAFEIGKKCTPSRLPWEQIWFCSKSIPYLLYLLILEKWNRTVSKWHGKGNSLL